MKRERGGADDTNGFRGGEVSPILQIRFNEVLTTNQAEDVPLIGGFPVKTRGPGQNCPGPRVF